MKKVLIMVTGPYQILQAIWFCIKHPEYECTALVKIANVTDSVRDKLVGYCSASGVFKDIQVTKGVGYDATFAQKAKLGMKMLAYFVVGQKQKLVHQIVKEEVDINEYDAILVDSEFSILGGAFINCAREKQVFIMQEGLSDVRARRKVPRFTPNDLMGFVISKMGYCNPGMYYTLRPTIHCSKFLSHPDLAVYNNFKSIVRLFEMNEEERNRFNQVVEQTFNKQKWNSIAEADVILFTSQFVLFTDNEEYYEDVYRWLKENAKDKRIVIKKHPRDRYPYDWKDLNISFIEESVPAEILMSQITKQKVLFMFYSTCILDAMQHEMDYLVFHFSRIHNEDYLTIFNDLQECLRTKDTRVIKLG